MGILETPKDDVINTHGLDLTKYLSLSTSPEGKTLVVFDLKGLKAAALARDQEEQTHRDAQG
jgi:hypothetical protein